MTKEKAPRKPRAQKTKKRDWSIIPIWAKSDDGIGIKRINMPANLDKAFVQRFGLMSIPDEAELLGWIQIHSA
jgi:hypothetical protein